MEKVSRERWIMRVGVGVKGSEREGPKEKAKETDRCGSMKYSGKRKTDSKINR